MRIAHALAKGNSSLHPCAEPVFRPQTAAEDPAGLNTVGFTDADTTQECGSGWHYNEGLELTVVANGQLPFEWRTGVYAHWVRGWPRPPPPGFIIAWAIRRSGLAGRAGS